ncbi:hypothetical protein EIN43_06160 [Enterobacter hormaechei]|uniref:Uncharacterized protein n=1 Tax=Enterobacter hormaechei TaxID=158836 RepID=A0A4Y5ZP24_9ENTR|nr:hypothetical protein EIN43_06160 [Enterobacter hormaechei]
MEVFHHLSAPATQWRVGASGRPALIITFSPDVRVTRVEDAAACMADLQIMESEALKVMHKETK